MIVWISQKYQNLVYDLRKWSQPLPTTQSFQQYAPHRFFLFVDNRIILILQWRSLSQQQTLEEEENQFIDLSAQRTTFLTEPDVCKRLYLTPCPLSSLRRENSENSEQLVRHWLPTLTYESWDSGVQAEWPSTARNIANFRLSKVQFSYRNKWVSPTPSALFAIVSRLSSPPTFYPLMTDEEYSTSLILCWLIDNHGDSISRKDSCTKLAIPLNLKYLQISLKALMREIRTSAILSRERSLSI